MADDGWLKSVTVLAIGQPKTLFVRLRHSTELTGTSSWYHKFVNNLLM